MILSISTNIGGDGSWRRKKNGWRPFKTGSLQHCLQGRCGRRFCRQKHCFSEIELLAIAYRYSENHQEKTAAMLMLADALPEPFSSYARSMAEWMGKSFELFTQQEAGAVFELHIQTEPNTYDERYLCADYDTALRMIPLFFE